MVVDEFLDEHRLDLRSVKARAALRQFTSRLISRMEKVVFDFNKLMK